MAEREDQLVAAVAAQVLAVLRERGMLGDATAGGASGRVHIQPPIGTCTGDYSKFPELQGRRVGADAASLPAAAGEASGGAKPQAFADERVPLTGIVTANQLRAAMDAAGTAVLALDAKLTPLANDMARQFPEKIKRAAASGKGEASPAVGADLPWMWWIDGQCPAVAQLTADLRPRLRSAGASSTSTSLPNVVRDLAGAIRHRTVAGGLLFVRSAARAIVLANRCASIRAVVATCGEAVEEGVTQIGANVLIVEYPHHGLRSMRAMVDRILQQPPKAPPSVERDLADLHRCG